MKSKIKELIESSKSIGLLTHENPDGDAIGSLIAFYLILRDMNKDVEVIASKIPERFKYLEDIDKIVDNSQKNFDLVIVLDCASKKRIGQIDNIVDRASQVIVIDHHVSNTLYGDINYIEGNTSSCAQVLYYLFKEWKWNINKECGKALMTGVLTDTSGFKNDNVDKNTYLMAAEMLDVGIDIYNLQREVLTIVTKPQLELKRIALDRLEFFDNGKIAFSYVTKKDMDSVGAMVGDHEGLVEIGRDIIGVEVSIFMREDEGFKISLRSNGSVKVNEIAEFFDGGGHEMAAGLNIDKNLEDAKNDIIRETMKVVDRYEWNTNS